MNSQARIHGIRAVKKVSLVALTSLVLAGCSVIGQSEPTRFYTLTQALSPAEGTERYDIPAPVYVGIGPVEIPGYADRPQIVTEGEAAVLKVADFHHWAEPVAENIERLLVANIAALTRSRQVFPYPARFNPDSKSLQASVEITEMTQQANGAVILTASWNVKRTLSNTLLVRESGAYQGTAPAGDYAAYAQTLGTLIGSLSRDMARSIASAAEMGT
ncbi:PqiC family protein [Sneathiella chinensis]|uniref:ABC-type transport auxiliary lipoprotein component domain-containing protein n=1 Tax=Sneathiella chinensis TaxID=349750 RepID=A0ABQ5U428_9PROT|nr:PqiC family protein [Sneathiella chinensis]GLQ06593.1 hypothetical protein GCM10007924_18140 [Sneathiella chinensis]